MLPGKSITPNEILAMLLRRKWLLLLPFSIGLAAAPFISARIPELYRSETLIMVIPQRVPDEYVKPTVTGNVGDRLTTINEVILSRSRLEQVINDFDLYKEERAVGIMEDIVKQMRDEITVAIDGRQSFRVAYVSNDREVAQKVANRLASLYIDENLRDRENLAEGTSLFLESQLAEAKIRLVEHEKRLEQYRERYSGELPSQLNSNFQSISGAQLRLQSNNEAMNRLRERRLTLERQIGDLQLAAPDNTSAPPTARQLLAAEEQLKQLRLRYTPDHPNIHAAERTISELKARVAEEIRNPPPPPELPSVEEVARRKRVEEITEDIALIDEQLRSREQEGVRINAGIEALQAKVASIPARESEMVELTRDYGTLQNNYMSLLAKRQESQLAENLERRQIGEQFRVLDPAFLPVRPFNLRERLVWTFSGAAVGLAIGLLLAALLELRDSSFKNDDDVLRALSLPVLALVPVIASDREKRVVFLRRLAVEFACATIVLLCIGVVIVWRLQL